MAIRQHQNQLIVYEAACQVWDYTLVPIDLFEEVTKSQASGWVVEAEDYKMPPVPMHFYRLVTLDSFFGHCCFLIIFRSVCLQLIGFSEWELLDKYM